MTESYTDGLRSSAVALLHSPLKRLAVPVIAIVAMAGLAEFLTYFAVAPAPVSQSAALAAPPATTEARSSTAGQAPATDTLTVVDRLRPFDEDIVKAFRLATEDRQPVVAQDAVFYTDQQSILIFLHAETQT
jgi:hypothetical protein